MIIVAIDPSLTRTAFVVKDGDEVTQYIAATIPRQPLPDRLRDIAQQISAIVMVSHADIVVIEQPGFVAPRRATGTEATQRVTGAILAGLPQGVRVELAVVTRVRSDLGIKVKRGKGEAKRAVIEWVEAQGHVLPRSPIAGNPDHDIADAIVLAHWAEAHL